MKHRPTRVLGAVALSLGVFAAGATTTQPASAQSADPATQNVRAERGERGSRHDIRSVERRLERMISRLQHDRRDYGGHRVNAIALMQQANVQLKAAIATDATTPH
ncbi:MAG: hypothetical protein NVSMB21_02820 [Vulcanimicrobiaceae bacterium]